MFDLVFREMRDFYNVCSTQFWLMVLITHTLQTNRQQVRGSNYEERISAAEMSENSVDVDVLVGLDDVSITMNEKLVYMHKRVPGTEPRDYEHSTGVHLLILHPYQLNVISKELFFTAQPSADVHLLRRLANVHDGRIVLLVGASNFTFWFRREAKEFFQDSGTILGPDVALGETWALIFRKGFSKWKGLELDSRYWGDPLYQEEDPVTKIENLNLQRRMVNKEKFQKKKTKFVSPEITKKQKRMNFQGTPFYTKKVIPGRIIGKFKILYEGVATVKNPAIAQSSPFRFSTTIQSLPDMACEWHKNRTLQDLADFCKQYDGYKPFCRCEDRVPLLPEFGPALPPDFEAIPVGIVTAKRLLQVLRQVRQLRAGAGGAIIPIYICVDGFNLEAKRLAQLLGVQVLFHDNQYNKGTRDRVNEHVGWTLRKLLEYNKSSNYSIILEDDLDLSPDFMHYFQQVAWLMDVDKKIMLANAYNYNAFPHSALDPTKTHIVRSYPYYGWMVRRDAALKMVAKWAKPEDKADWDLYIHYHHLNESFVVIPEVPRTKHIGGGGVHVSGYIQETEYNARPLNKIPQVEINLRRHWTEAYSLDLMKFAITATVLNITDKPCSEPLLSTKKPGGKYVIYLNLTGDGDDAWAYFTITKCLGFFGENMFEQLSGAFMRRYFYNEVLLIACPVSPYCHINENRSLIYTPSKEDIQDAERYPFLHTYAEVEILHRVKPADDWDEMIMTNIFSYLMNIEE